MTKLELSEPGATIFAQASGVGRAGIAVVRISGPGAHAVACEMSGQRELTPRYAQLTAFRDPENGEVMDRGLLLWFPRPHSFTGEDVAEFQVHGGRAVIARLYKVLSRRPKTRLAEPGEFTRRAFENGRLDLTAAEGIADLVAAETEAQRRQALRQTEGALGRLYEGWRGELMTALAYVEAEIDFTDEELPVGTGSRGLAAAARLRVEIAAHLDDAHLGERLRDGFQIAIIGPPNVGKSSILNRLARRDAAIVSDIAGTTRDVVEVHLDLAGFPVIVADTAGLREAEEGVEAEGVRRARLRADTADLVVWVRDANDAGPITDSAGSGTPDLQVWNKVDLAPGKSVPGLAVSALDGTGFAAFEAALRAAVVTRFDGVSAAPLVTRTRHRTALEDCVEHLRRAVAGGGDLELPAEDLRLAARALGRITGHVDVEELLDVIFQDFCIGK